MIRQDPVIDKLPAEPVGNDHNDTLDIRSRRESGGLADVHVQPVQLGYFSLGRFAVVAVAVDGAGEAVRAGHIFLLTVF